MTTARDLMRPCPQVRKDETVAEALRLMAAAQGHPLAVVDANGKLVGILTEHDLVGLIYDSGTFNVSESVVGSMPAYLGYTTEQLRALKIDEIMTNDPETVGPNATVDDLVESVFRNRRKVVLVVEAGRPVGAVGRMDLVQKVLG